MSKRDQAHQHNWQKRVRDWLIMPHSRPTELARVISTEELSRHATKEDCWLAVHGKVYDVSRFLMHHPGGPRVIEQYAGRDCSAAYERNHTRLDPDLVVGMCRIGLLDTGSEAHADTPIWSTAAAGAPQQNRGPQFSKKRQLGDGDVADVAKRSGFFSDVPESTIDSMAKEVANDMSRGSADETAAFLAVFEMLDKDNVGTVPREAVLDLLASLDPKADVERIAQAFPQQVTRDVFMGVMQCL